LSLKPGLAKALGITPALRLPMAVAVRKCRRDRVARPDGIRLAKLCFLDVFNLMQPKAGNIDLKQSHGQANRE